MLCIVFPQMQLDLPAKRSLLKMTLELDSV